MASAVLVYVIHTILTIQFKGRNALLNNYFWTKEKHLGERFRIHFIFNGVYKSPTVNNLLQNQVLNSLLKQCFDFLISNVPFYSPRIREQRRRSSHTHATMWQVAQGGFLFALEAVALYVLLDYNYYPAVAGLLSCTIWGLVLSLRGWRRMDIWEKRLVTWSVFSIASFSYFLVGDPSFQSWSSVYFFCGPNYEYCTSSFRWNIHGWRKAFVLWNFCLSFALALQRLAIEAGLGGLLPGEEAVTRESFISVIWRLIPFWLNRWESNFGAECSSILFELPHFALELLVVLPLVQIMAGRLRVVGHPHLRAAAAVVVVPPGAEREDAAVVALAPDVLRCAWVNDSSQRRLLPRLRAHCRTMAVICLISSGINGLNLCVFWHCILCEHQS